MPDDPKTTVWASIGQTIATRQYENIKIDIGVSGIPVSCSDEELNQRLEAASFTLDRVVNALATQLARRVKEDLGR